jgi:SNF2 family DNA or RNA helicase
MSKAVDRRSDIHRNGCGDAADSGIPGVFGRLLLFLKRAAKNQVHGSLRVGGGMNDEAVILFQLLIVAPGSLVEQWRDELFEKFGLEFSIYSPALEQATPNANPFESHHQLIVRLDQISRNEELQEKLCAPGWDLAVFDEAHKLAAHYSGSKLDKTARFEFAEKLGATTRHLLLMTATPHNGKEEDFQLFLSLLDSDRFYGKFRDGAHKIDASDLMRRMVKEELVRFDGTPLFPERKAYTVNYKLSDLEAALYESVTHYVQTEMGKADQLAGPRKGSVGFALTALQRRLASSPEAIYQSLKRRKERLERRLREEKLGIRGREAFADTLRSVPEDDDDLNAEEQENLEEELVDQAREHPHLDHGYAVTSHSSQGQTAERVLIHVDTELAAKDLLNSRMAYVAVSRGAEDAQLFTNDREKLPQALGHDVSHESAHVPAMKPEQAITPPQPEIAPVIEHGMGLGHSL